MTDSRPPIDDATLRQLVEDVGPERAEVLLRVFMRETRGRVRRILAAAGERDLAALGDECHTLKGAAASFGAAAVEQTADRIATACFSGEKEAAFALVGGLAGLVDLALSAFEARLSGEAS